MEKPNVSIVLPVYNEQGSLAELLSCLHTTLALCVDQYEIIAINDGSHDNSWDVLKQLASQSPRVRLINFSRNCGQTAAIDAGIRHAQYDIIIPIDADLENNPSDIPLLLEKMNKGYDVVSGYRGDRWRGSWLSRKLPSILANKLISWLSGVHLSDYGCTLKAYRKEVLANLRLYGDMHRFIPAYAHWNHSAKIAEVPVSYTPRKHGKSNYGMGRTWKVLLDLLVLKFFADYSRRPIHLFGSMGFISILGGLGAGLLSVYFKFSVVYHKDFVQTPLPVLMVMLVVVGVMLIMMGLLAEILVRTYFESRDRESDKIKETVNI